MMKDEYDLSTMKSRKNPHVSKLKKPVAMLLGEDVIEYFKNTIEESVCHIKAWLICICGIV